MSVYGNSIFYTNESTDEIDIFEETTVMSVVLEMNAINEGAAKIPKELTISDPNEIQSASTFKSKMDKIVKFMVDNNYPEKKMSKTIYMTYYGIIGNTFDGTCEKYEPKFAYYIGLVNKYCIDKHKALIKKDMEKTLAALDKQAAKKPLTDLQKAYAADVKANVNKL